jgi:hypothetical protein
VQLLVLVNWTVIWTVSPPAMNALVVTMPNISSDEFPPCLSRVAFF